MSRARLDLAHIALRVRVLVLWPRLGLHDSLSRFGRINEEMKQLDAKSHRSWTEARALMELTVLTDEGIVSEKRTKEEEVKSE